MSAHEKTRTHYEVLAVARTASKAEIRKAYIKAVRTSHPDTNPGVDPAIFVAVQSAYDTLFDDAKRTSYDYELSRSESRAQTGSSSTDSPSTPRPSRPEGASLHFPERTHVYEDGPGDGPLDPLLRRTLLLIGLGAFALGTALWILLPGTIETGTFGQVVLNQWILHYGAISAAGVAALFLTIGFTGHPYSGAGAFSLAAVLATPAIALTGRGGESPWTWVGASLLVVSGIILNLGYRTTSADGSRLGDAERDINPEIFTFPIFGEPASGLEQSTLDAGRVAVGAKGERLTAEGLKKLAGLDGLKIMHSMRFNPYEAGHGDVDHMVVYGRNIILIDSKMWAPARYAFSTGADGTIMDDEQIVEARADGTIGIRTVKMMRAAELWSQAFPSYNVVCWIIIHPSNTAQPLTLDNTGSVAMRMSTLDDGLQEILDHLGNATESTVYSKAADLTKINRLHA